MGEQESLKSGIPWWHWAVSIAALVYGIFGMFDFVMTYTGDEKYLKDFPPEMIAWIGEFPLWRNILWVITVFGTLLGAVFLLMRKKIAAKIYAAALLSMLIGFVIHDILMANGLKMYGQMGIVASVILVLILALFWLYARFAARRGIIT